MSIHEQESLLDHGFVVVPGLISPERCEAIRQAAQEQLNEAETPLEFEADLLYPGAPESKYAPGGNTVRRLVGAYDRHYEFAQWATSPAIRDWMEAYFNEAPHLVLSHHNTIFTKHPTYGSLTDWHRDGRHWLYKSGDLVNAWLALGDEHVDNGALWFVPSSNNMHIAPDRFTKAKFLRADLPENRALVEKAVSPTLKAGDVVFFHANTLHAAGKNHTDQVKLSLVFTYHGASNSPLPGTRSASKPEVAF